MLRETTKEKGKQDVRQHNRKNEWKGQAMMGTKSNRLVTKGDRRIVHLVAGISELTEDVSASGSNVNSLAPVRNDDMREFIMSFDKYDRLEEVEEKNSLPQKTNKELPELTGPDINKMYSELLETKKELEQFVYMASHDLQEPLRMIASYTQLLAKRYKGKLDTDADDFISYAVDGANRMQTMIKSFLKYSRADKSEKELKLTDCEAVLQSAVANLRLVIEESRAIITHDQLPSVMSDGVQLLQVFQNLIENAIKFCSYKRPEIHIGSERRNGEWVFYVRDNGAGIADLHKEQIFNIFQRAHERDTYPGSGIGLAICKKIVERLGGRIMVESELEKGSVFYFSIPE